MASRVNRCSLLRYKDELLRRKNSVMDQITAVTIVSLCPSKKFTHMNSQMNRLIKKAN